MPRTNIRIAIQKKGRLKEQSLDFIRSLGFEVPPAGEHTFIVPCVDADVEILHVRNGDVPQYVMSGAADFGIVGGDVLYEDRFEVKVLRELGFGECELVVAVPNRSAIGEVADLEGERIATSYPNSLRKFLKKCDVNASIITIRGSVEIAPALDLADGVCDLTQTGKTLKENDLRIVATLRSFRATLIESPLSRVAKERFMADRTLETAR